MQCILCFFFNSLRSFHWPPHVLTMSPSSTVWYSTWSLNIARIRTVFIHESTVILKKIFSSVDTSLHTSYWILWALEEMGFKNFCVSWIPQSGLIWNGMDINTSGPLEIKKRALFCPLFLSSLSFSPVEEGCWQATDLPSLPPSISLSPPHSLFSSLHFPESWCGIPIGADGSTMVHAFPL